MSDLRFVWIGFSTTQDRQKISYSECRNGIISNNIKDVFMKVGQRHTKIKGPEMKIMIEIRLNKAILLDTHINPPIRDNRELKLIPHKFVGNPQIIHRVPKRHIIV